MIKKILSKALTGKEGGISSRKYAGLCVMLVLVVLSFIGGGYYIFVDAKIFIEILEIVTYLCTVLLGNYNF